MSGKLFKRIQLWTLITGVVLGGVLLLGFNKVVEATSSDEFCNKCHFHPHATTTWKQGVHYNTASGTIVHCVECHLPSKGEGYLPAKVVTGLRDVYGAVFKDSADFNWDLKSRPENAVHFTRDVSCVHCHQNLYPLEITHEGMDAHLYYEQQEGEVSCIKCHIDAGHYHEGILHAANVEFGTSEELPDTLYLQPAIVETFEDYTERLPLSAVSFNMKAIPGGTFTMGAGEEDPFSRPDERPEREVTLDPFFMSEIEVTWEEYLTWYSQTSGEGRTTDIGMLEGIDGLSGATPPYGNPDQGWGKGKRPAITMTYYAAEKYCEWLSLVTGKTYRLPTEAEWEYAARGGTKGPYFFGGEVKDYADVGLRARLFGVDTTVINSYAVYIQNSEGRSQLPGAVRPNPFGLKNMLGNVAEFCQDIYIEDAYSQYPGPVANPVVVAGGNEHVIRGGSFLSDAAELRVSARNKTNHDSWLRTDPQIPKSLWWYSDCYHVGFRVVCEYDDHLTTK
ncbi:MAG: SUMF1/EgtB/PvdO family nonheme iron enzyme [Bacteroidales bacterium]|nr:SUMF1/EgtB/PvdO family nonheme iron enzyme [Bacteroidales bacterium]MDT8431575.1 SUMF1/EgtB/PvdO family nonheme iron enzyme [Bacteroidales bacterium]